MWDWSWRPCCWPVEASKEASSQVTNTPLALEPEANTQTAAQVTADQETALGEQTEEAQLAKAAVKPISTGKPLPPNIKPTGPVSEVIKLADSGVDDSVMMAFVTNSTNPFNLGVEDIIYLNDIGFSGSVITAMMQRDQALKELSANPAAMPAGPALGTPGNQFAPEPGTPVSYAPQPAATLAPTDVAPEAPPPGDYAAENDLLPSAADTGYSTFYGSLAPYGTWVDVAGYGPCWQPTVVVINPTWQPYCDAGRWVYTDCGWYWLSGYSWGWATFHYGRWFRHHSLGWCWVPDTVWGPSWVCWRYSGSYCGWAPLPPGAWYQPGAGLTYRGHPVNGTFGFGLSVRSFAFVDVSHFRDLHLNRHALPLQQAAQVYNTTAVSATIVANNNRVINSGIPVGRVAAATETTIHQIAIREVNGPAGQGTRGERFEGSSRTMAVFHPHFPASMGTQPGPGRRPRSELRNEGSIPPAASTTHGVMRDPSPPVVGGALAAPPNATEPLDKRAERPTTVAKGTATTATGSVGAIRPLRSDPAPRFTAPLILHGPGRPGQGATGSSPGAVREAFPPDALVVTGSKEAKPQKTASQSSAWTTEMPQSWSTALSQDAVPHSVVSQKPPPVTTWPARWEPPWSASRPAEPSARSEPQRQYAAPSYQTQAPTEAWRSASALASAPQPTRSYSTSSASAASTPVSHAHTSSDRNGR